MTGILVLEELVRASVTQAIQSLDLPTRRDLDELSRKFERVAEAVEPLERAYLPANQVTTRASAKPGRSERASSE